MDYEGNRDDAPDSSDGEDYETMASLSGPRAVPGAGAKPGPASRSRPPPLVMPAGGGDAGAPTSKGPGVEGVEGVSNLSYQQHILKNGHAQGHVKKKGKGVKWGVVS